jgi:HAD superfamily hydrolase (TIGR01509 family)
MIKFVYFDVGGVIIKDFSATNKWEKLLDEFKLDKETWEEKYGDNIDRGILPTDVSINYQDLLEGFVSRFEKNKGIWPVIANIQKTSNAGLFTNMYPGMLDSIYKHELMPAIKWDVVIDSSVEKIRKPDRELLEIAEKRSRVGKDEILFVDNSTKNIEAAKAFGWQTFLFDSSDYKNSCKKLEKAWPSFAKASEG